MEAHSLIDCVEDARVIEITDSWETRSLSTESTQGAIVCDYRWSKVSAVNEGEDVLHVEPCLEPIASPE
jgi:hypothetical protein